MKFFEMTTTDGKGGRVKFDGSGAGVFVLAALSIPVVGFVSGFGFGTVMLALVALTGFVHFWVSFFALVVRLAKADAQAEKKESTDDQR